MRKKQVGNKMNNMISPTVAKRMAASAGMSDLTANLLAEVAGPLGVG